MSAAGGLRYRTIVADPPWAYPEGFGVGLGNGRGKRRVPLPYPSMTLEAISALPVGEMADPAGCHLYLWTTNRYLNAAFDIARAWGFKHGQTLVWAKRPIASILGGAFGSNLEFCLFCRRGTLRHKRKVHTAWFEWSRAGIGNHSRKPEAFLDLVEQVSPGPYLELFARRQRLGWDTWGDEALNHVVLQAERRDATRLSNARQPMSPSQRSEELSERAWESTS
jgi:N6-adenosine-specific RNA methylase IME4